MVREQNGMSGPRSARERGWSNNYARNMMQMVSEPKGEAWVKSKLSEASIEPPEMLVDGMIPTGMVGSILAAGGAGKTLVAVYLAIQAMRRGFKVAFLDKENGARIMRERFEMMGADLAALERDGLIAFYDHPTAGRDAETVAGYVAMLEAEKPDILMIDAWVGFLGSCGFEENSATDIAAWADLYTTPARSRGIAVLLLDHTPKDSTNRTARGSSRKRDYVDFQYELEKAGVIDRENTGIITLKLKKDRGAWLRGVHQFRVGGTASGFVFEPIDAPHDPVGDASASGERKTLDALGDGGLTFSEWEDASEETNSTFKRRRIALLNAGAVYQDADGLYWPTGKGPRGPNGVHGPSGPSNDQDRTVRVHEGHTPRGGPVDPPDSGPLRNGSGGLPSGDFASPPHRQNPPQGSEEKEGSEVDAGLENLSSPAGGSAPGVALGGNDVVELGVPDEDERQIRDLMRRGFSEGSARAEVLAKDHPLDCGCEVCA